MSDDYKPSGPYAEIESGNAYIVTESGWGERHHWIVGAANLKEAQQQHGWTRQLHHSRRVRRARTSDLEQGWPVR